MHQRSAVLVAVLVTVGMLPVGVAFGPTGAASAVPVDDGECEFPVTKVDKTGTEVTVEEEPETVVTLNPSAAQTMWEIGAEEKVIGVTRHAMNLEGAEERTNISTGGETIDIETVVHLDPDIVLAPDSKVVSEETVEKLREVGLTVYLYHDEESIEDVYEKTRVTGQLVGECEGAEETVGWMQQEIGIVENAVDGEQRPRVLYVFFDFTAGEGTFVHEIITAAGADNVAAEVGIEGYQRVNDETVVDEDPDRLILNDNDPQVPDREAYQETTAVQEDQIIVVNTSYLNRPGPRIVHAITQLAEAFHPEAYEEARAEAGATPTPTPSPDPEPESEATPTPIPEATDMPGFGIIVALVALLTAVRVANRRNNGPL